MQGTSGSAICSLCIQFCSYANSVGIDLGNAIERSIDFIDSCNVRLRLVKCHTIVNGKSKAYIDKIDACEFASFEPGFELFQGDLYQRWEPS